MQLLDREKEIAALDGLLAATRGGRSGTLILRGETGVGLTALLDYAVASGSGMRIIRVPAVESEIQLAFAGVHRLCAPVLDRLEDLPGPQRDALASAFGLIEGRSPDRFLVGLAVLTLLSDAAEQQPVLCVLDDAQWLDDASAEAVAFVARRLEEESVALVFALREPTPRRMAMAGLPELVVGGLPHDHARELLATVVAGPLDLGVRDRMVAETGGNPLALLELSSELTPDQLSGESRLPEPLPLGAHLAESFLGQVRGLPPETHALLLLAAAEPQPDSRLLWRAAELLGIPVDAAGPAEQEGLVRVSDQVVFRHPLIRSAIYLAATAAERRRAHLALAEATEANLEPERRAWHRAAASLGPDEEIALELERSADRTLERVDDSSAASLLEQAARLTPDPRRRTTRILKAAQAALDAGAAGKAMGLLATVGREPSDALQRARTQRLRGAISFALGQGDDGAVLLLQAARALVALDVRLARDAHLEALEAAIYAGRLGSGGGLLAAAAAAREAPVVPKEYAAAPDHLLDGLAALLSVGHQVAIPALRRAIDALRQTDDLRWYPLGCLAAVEIWDDEGLHALTTRQVQLARAAGALTTLPLALEKLGALDDVLAGRLDGAETRLAEARELSAATGKPPGVAGLSPGELIVSAWRGRSLEAHELAEACTRAAIAGGLGRYVTFAQYAMAVLELGHRRYEQALIEARGACEDRALALVTLALPELVEAAVRGGDSETASVAARRLAERALPSGTDWALGTLARSQALIADDSEAEGLYLAAIEHLKRCRPAFHLARAHLVYGEWLRRRRRRRDAREQLSVAYEMFASFGADAFGERARIELAATGEHVRRRTVASAERLTPHEARIAGLVSEGASNPEIAAQLFISPRTVEYHLHKVFRKLEITSRTQLARVMIDEG